MKSFIWQIYYKTVLCKGRKNRYELIAVNSLGKQAGGILTHVTPPQNKISIPLYTTPRLGIEVYILCANFRLRGWPL